MFATSWLDSEPVLFTPTGSLHLPTSQKDLHSLGVIEHVEKMKQDLLAKVKALGKELPLNTLDELINHFGGPDHVAEVWQPEQGNCLGAPGAPVGQGQPDWLFLMSP